MAGQRDAARFRGPMIACRLALRAGGIGADPVRHAVLDRASARTKPISSRFELRLVVSNAVSRASMSVVLT